MKSFVVTFLGFSVLFSQFANAHTLVCFTKNEPVNDPEIIRLEEREIYFTSDQEGRASIAIWRQGEKQYAGDCVLGDGMGIGTEHVCGHELLMLDFANNWGSLTRKTDSLGVYATQSLVCRDIDDLIVPTP